MEKITNAVALNYVLTNCTLPDEVATKLTKMLEQVEKKNSAERKPSAKQTENGQLKVAIFAGMEDGTAYTISDMIKEIPCLAEMSNQRVSALVRQMVSDNLLDRQEIKRKAYFTKVVAE